ncbi:siphovirus ReqiPepy6 Gp37-like family protein [Streptomyces sp. NBC_01241]|uniref:siphovirus ReqiPepy6 Gp37-like family protein n=1 Tax=Streptomyces sp. NBC_01241 TaxID=2903794 RepID=UPI00352CC5E2|nr:siphovirus ReqiPepy6 Gp37-like family protein [Streptomyces sp. NBC_01241]
MGYRVEVRDKDLNRVGIIDTWLQLDIIVRFCAQGSWKLLVRAGTEQAELLQRGGGVAIYQDGVKKPIITGQIEDFQKYFTVEQHSSMGSLFVGGSCDNKLAYSRLAFPDPARAVDKQYLSTVDTRTVNTPGSSAIWNELEKSMGTSALSDRRIPGVKIGPKPTFGDTVNDTVRYDVIGEKLAGWCEAKKLGYRFLYDPNSKTIDLDIFTPRDLSKEVRLSTDLGNLREYIWTLSAPKVTRVIVACQGEGKGRYLYQKIDAEAEAEWGLKIEQFVDRRDLPIVTDMATGKPVKASLDVTTAEFESALEAVKQSAEEVLKEGEKSGNFQVYPIDTEQIKFGRDYFVGDLVTVIADGTEYVDMVREVNITVDDGGNAYTVSPKIGEQGSGDPLNLYKTVFEMREKLRKLEARM